MAVTGARCQDVGMAEELAPERSEGVTAIQKARGGSAKGTAAGPP